MNAKRYLQCAVGRKSLSRHNAFGSGLTAVVANDLRFALMWDNDTIFANLQEQSGRLRQFRGGGGLWYTVCRLVKVSFGTRLRRKQTRSSSQDEHKIYNQSTIMRVHFIRNDEIHSLALRVQLFLKGIEGRSR
jgi:hypothetical protein